MPTFAPFLLLGIIVLATIVAVASISKKSRDAAARQVLDRSGMTRQNKPFATDADPRWRPFASIRSLKGGHKRVTWAVHGSIDRRDVIGIEHRYVVSTGQATVVIVHTCSGTRCPGFWPLIELKPKGLVHRLGDKVGKRFGVERLMLESEAFNRRWRVDTLDVDQATAILTPQVQELLAQAPRSEQWRLGQGWVVVCRRQTIKPEQLSAFMRRPVDLLALVPPEMLVELPSERR